MATTDVEESREMVVSPTLKETVPVTTGVYYIKNTHRVDSTNLTLVGTTHEIILGP
jgi:hypothetical protein